MKSEITDDKISADFNSENQQNLEAPVRKCEAPQKLSDQKNINFEVHMLCFKSSISYKFCLLIDIPNLVRAFQESPAEGGKMSNSKQNQRQFDLADERNFKPTKWMVKA